MSLARSFALPRANCSTLSLGNKPLWRQTRFLSTQNFSSSLAPASTSTSTSASASASASSTAAAASTTEYLAAPQAKAKQNFESGNLAEAYGYSKEAGMLGESGLLQKYGPWTVGSLAFAAAVSNEWILLGEETPIVITFAGVVFAGYVNFREGFNKSMKEEMDSRYAHHERAIDGAVAAIEDNIKAVEKFREIPGQFQQSWTAFQTLLNRYSGALTRSAQLEVNSQFEARLEGLVKLENRLKDNKTEDLRSSVGRYLREKIRTKPASYRDGLVNDSLSSLLILQHQAWQKYHKVDAKKAFAHEGFQKALKSVATKVDNPEALDVLAKRAVERTNIARAAAENPQIQALYNEFLTEFDKKCGKPLVRTLSDAEYKKLVDDAEKRTQQELDAFEKKNKEKRDALEKNTPLLKGEKLAVFLAEFDANAAAQREAIKSRKVVPSKTVSEFIPFYSK